MREWLSHDFIANRHCLKKFFPQIANYDYEKKFLQNLHKWIWAFCSYIDPCVGHLHFLRGTNLQFSTVTTGMHFLFKLILAFDRTIGADFVLGMKGTH